MSQDMRGDRLVAQGRAVRGGRGGVLAAARPTASVVSGPRRRVGNSGSVGSPACSRSQSRRTAAVWRVSGVTRFLRPLPWQRTWRRCRGACRARRSPVSSETRSPVWMASVSSAWSRRPIQVLRSGRPAARDLGRGQVATLGAVAALGRDGQNAADQRGVFGCVQCGEPEQRVDRGQPGVAGAHAVAPLRLQVGQERPDRAGRRRRPCPARRAACPSVAGRRTAAAAACRGRRRWCAGLAWRWPDQPFGEERLAGSGASAAHRPAPGGSAPGGRRPWRAARGRRAGTSRCWRDRRGRARCDSAGSRACTSAPSRYQPSRVATAKLWRLCGIPHKRH